MVGMGPAAIVAAVVSIARLCIAARAPDQRVLFIGNSFSYVEGGVWTQYKTIAEGCIPGLIVKTDFNAVGGRSLAMASGDPGARHQVEAGDYDILVLQDHSNLIDHDDGNFTIHEFYGPQAKQHNATVGMYQTWAKPDQGNFTATTLWRARVYEDYAQTAKAAGANVIVAQAGEAFLQMLQFYNDDTDWPAFRALYARDGSHPSALGINLVAWVMVMAFNVGILPAGGCDPQRVPLAPRQNDQQRQQFFQIACQLAGMCPTQAPTAPPPLCKAAQAMQGNWLHNKTGCNTGKDERKLATCIHLQYWKVSGRAVTGGDGSQAHSLRVRDWGSFCSVKLLPAFVMVHRVTSAKVVFNNCEVWTRVGSTERAKLDECQCITPDKWKDNHGDTCAVYKPGQRKHHLCSSGAGWIISVRKGLQMYAWQACPGCSRCDLAEAT